MFKKLAASAALLIAGMIGFSAVPAFADEAPPPEEVVATDTTAEQPVEEAPVPVVVETPTVEETPAEEPTDADNPTTTFSRVQNTQEKLPICHSGSGNHWTYIAPDASGYNGHQHHDADIYGLSEEECLAKNVNEEPPPPADVDYTTVAWLAGAAPPHHFDVPQTYLFSEDTEDPALHTLDDNIASYLATLKCDAEVDLQIDVYIDDATTDALIAGGVLYGPNNPTEHLISGGEGTAWKFVHLQAEACPPPVDEPNHKVKTWEGCGYWGAKLKNPSTSENEQLTASFVVWVDDQFYGAYAVTEGEHQVIGDTFAEDTGLHTVRIEAGSAQGGQVLATISDIESDCIPPQPENKVTYTEWVDGEYECDDTEVTQTRSKTVTPYILVEGQWVEDTENSVTTEESQSRQLNADEIKPCPVPPTTPGESLAMTGQSPAGIIGLAAAMLIGGAALSIARMRRKVTEES